MIHFISNLADFTGPGAFIILLVMWVYVSSKNKDFSIFKYMVNGLELFDEYKTISKRENGKPGYLHKIFLILVFVTLASILISAAN